MAEKPAGKTSTPELARKRFRMCVDAERERRNKQLDDKKFAAGEHWPAKIRSEREAEGRPCLVIDRLKPQIKQVTNQQRAMRPAIQVAAVDSKGDPAVAEVLQGLIRNIETNSDADDAYDQSGGDQVIAGIGWIRVKTEYSDDDSGNQDILIDNERNPFSVYCDPAAKKRDRRDARYAFEVTDFLAEEVREKYGNDTLVGSDEFNETLGNDAPIWMDGETIRVVKYWHVEEARSSKEVGTRAIPVTKRTVKCDVMTGLQVLESYEWPGKWIPLVPVLGEETDIEGKVDLRGMVRDSKDNQRSINYWKSATTEAMALAPLSPYIAAEGQTEPFAKMWKNANRKRLPVLIYKPTTIGGRLAPPPARQVYEPAVQAFMALTQAAENDLRASTGFFDVGERETKEQSGRAILARQKMGEHGNSDYLDGLSRAIRHVGRILIDLIPHYYDAQRIVRILGLDGKEKTVMVHAGNAPEIDPTTGQPAALPEGVEGVYDLSVGKYDVVVKAGTAMTAREEFTEFMGQLFQAKPDLFTVFGDLFFENIDAPHAKQMAERAKKLLPPALQDDDSQNPAAIQAQMQAMTLQMQEMQAALADAQKQLITKQAEIESKERITAAEIASKEKIAAIQAEVDKAKLMVEGRIAMIKAQQADHHLAVTEGRAATETALQQAHERMMAERAGEQAIESQGREHEHAAEMQAMKPKESK